jgi:hypothetical protein
MRRVLEGLRSVLKHSYARERVLMARVSGLMLTAAACS